MGAWLFTRLEDPDEADAREMYTLSGMAGAMGAAFSAPLFAAVLASELSPTRKENYAAAFIPELFAATIGFVVYFGVTGSTMLGSYALPAYDFRVEHLLIAVLLGVLSAFIPILFALIKKLVSVLSFQRFPTL